MSTRPRSSSKSSKVKFDNQKLLQEVLKCLPYSSWEDMGGGGWRDGTKENPSKQLTEFGLYDFKTQEKISISRLAKQLGISVKDYILSTGEEVESVFEINNPETEKTQTRKGDQDEYRKNTKGDKTKTSGSGVPSGSGAGTTREIQGKGEDNSKERYSEDDEESRTAYEARIKTFFSDPSKIKTVWKSHALFMLDYFKRERGFSHFKGEEGKPVINWLVAQLKSCHAHVGAEYISQKGISKDKAIKEIKIPLYSLLSESQTHVIQQYRVLREDLGGEWKKASKKLLWKKDEPCAIELSVAGEGDGKDLNTSKVCYWVVEGVEDAFTLGASLFMRLRINAAAPFVPFKEVSTHKIIISAGKAGIKKIVAALIQKDPRIKESGFVVVLCDNDKDGGAERCSAGVEKLSRYGGVIRIINRKTQEDINQSLYSRGVEGVKEWLEGVRVVLQNPELLDGVGGETGADTGTNTNRVEKPEKEKADRQDRQDGRAPDPFGVREKLEELAVWNVWTERGAARLFSETRGDLYRITEDGRVWFFDGQKWGDDGEVALFREVDVLMQAYESLVGLFHEQDGTADEGSRSERCERFRLRLFTDKNQRSVVSQIRRFGVEHCLVSDFDKNPRVINCRNGLLDLRTLKLRPAEAGDMCSRMAGASYIPVGDRGKGTGGAGGDGRTPLFSRFLDEIMCGDGEMITYKWLQYGYIVSGETSAKVAFFHYGETGNNGKSTEADILRTLMGSYAITGSNDLILDKHYGNEQVFQLAKLPGVRLCVCGEIEEGRKFSESTVKMITGAGDNIICRHMRKEHFEFKPHVKLMIHANNKPKVKAGDAAFWRRIHFIPYTFHAENPDTGLRDRIVREEGDLIFSRMCDSYSMWKNNGLLVADIMQSAVDEYQEDEVSDMAEFLADMCTIDGHSEVRSSELYAAYVGYCKARNVWAKNQTVFGRFLTQMGIEAKRNMTSKVRIGVRLNDDIDTGTSDLFDDDEDGTPPKKPAQGSFKNDDDDGEIPF